MQSFQSPSGVPQIDANFLKFPLPSAFIFSKKM